MIEYIKFWASKDLYELGVGLAIIAALFALYMLLYIGDKIIKRIARRIQREEYKE